MRFYKNLREIEQNTRQAFERFGINKIREITRLIFEISKRDGGSFADIAGSLSGKKFSFVKNELLRKRYPENFGKSKSALFYLPKLEINQNHKAETGSYRFYPETIFVEDGSEKSGVVSGFIKTFPKAGVKKIPSLKHYLKDISFDINDYNGRTDRVFIVNEKYDFVKSCPCTAGAVPCGYDILNIGFGCPYECAYCFLQGYQNFPGIIIPANIEDFFRNFKLPQKMPGMFESARIGSGEFTDSLAFDGITGFSSQIIDFFREFPNVNFEFKTKSKNIANVLASKPCGNIVVSWSLNPEIMIKENEFYTASIKERIHCAVECAKAGFGVGFHFDPIIYYPGWEKDYLSAVNRIFDEVPEKSIKWISLGTLRMTPALKKIIENRFPENRILDTELILGYDRKLRYSEDIRIHIYRKMIEWIRSRSRIVQFYLCMEDKNTWKKSGLV